MASVTKEKLFREALLQELSDARKGEQLVREVGARCIAAATVNNALIDNQNRS